MHLFACRLEKLRQQIGKGLRLAVGDIVGLPGGGFGFQRQPQRVGNVFHAGKIGEVPPAVYQRNARAAVAGKQARDNAGVAHAEQTARADNHARHAALAHKVFCQNFAADIVV